MTLDELYVAVTKAIYDAEHATAENRVAAYRRVSEIEETIAGVATDPLDVSIARRGAVSSACEAGDEDRARRLAAMWAKG